MTSPPARLFEVPAAEMAEAQMCWLGDGAVSEHLAIAKLLAAGHKVAKPVVDDDGVDLIVNYRTIVQVKGSTYRHPHDGHLRIFLRQGHRPHIDVLIVHARDTDEWWVLPRDAMVKYSQTRATCIDLGRQMDQWRDAWDAFPNLAAA